MRMKRIAAAAIAALSLAIVAPAARAADPYEIDVILPLTGSTAFVGATQQTAIKAVQDYVNKNGGIDGRPVSFPSYRLATGRPMGTWWSIVTSLTIGSRLSTSSDTKNSMSGVIENYFF